MAKGRTLTDGPAAFVRGAIERERARRGDTLKPIEIVKVALSAYLARTFSDEPADALPAEVESPDRVNLRHGTQSAVDRLLFNANYWRAAYESLNAAGA